jgi:hypothetical protein
MGTNAKTHENTQFLSKWDKAHLLRKRVTIRTQYSTEVKNRPPKRGGDSARN